MGLLPLAAILVLLGRGGWLNETFDGTKKAGRGIRPISINVGSLDGEGLHRELGELLEVSSQAL